MLGEDGRLVVELDIHGAPIPQVLGAVMGAAALALERPRGRARRDRARSSTGRWGGLAADVEIRVVAEAMWNGVRPPLAAAGRVAAGRSARGDAVARVGPDQRWAMEVLGLRAGMDVERDDVNRRFRRLLRDAHPDSGGASAGAAARIAELTEARTILHGALRPRPSRPRDSRGSGRRRERAVASAP